MSPSRPFILRPVATALLMAALFLTGGAATSCCRCPRFPKWTTRRSRYSPSTLVRTPSVVASAVTAPLERQFGQVAGLSEMTSTSADGISAIVLQFQLSLNIDVAEQEVQAAHQHGAEASCRPTCRPAGLQQVQSGRRSGADARPHLQRDRATAGGRPGGYALAPKISQISGVGRVKHLRRPKPAVRIQANPTALAAYGINLEDLRNALVGNSLNSAIGNFDGPSQDYTINANDQLLHERRLQVRRRRVSRRLAGHAHRCRSRHRRSGEQQARRRGRTARRPSF